MPIGVTVFNANYTTMPDARCEIVLADKTSIERGLSVGLEIARDYDDRGIGGTVSGNVRYVAATETGRKAQIGDLIRAKLANQTEWLKVRVSNRLETAGVVRLDVEGENER
jgi:hypothetical protein